MTRTHTTRHHVLQTQRARLRHPFSPQHKHLRRNLNTFSRPRLYSRDDRGNDAQRYQRNSQVHDDSYERWSAWLVGMHVRIFGGSSPPPYRERCGLRAARVIIWIIFLRKYVKVPFVRLHRFGISWVAELNPRNSATSFADLRSYV